MPLVYQDFVCKYLRDQSGHVQFEVNILTFNNWDRAAELYAEWRSRNKTPPKQDDLNSKKESLKKALTWDGKSKIRFSSTSRDLDETRQREFLIQDEAIINLLKEVTTMQSCEIPDNTGRNLSCACSSNNEPLVHNRQATLDESCVSDNSLWESITADGQAFRRIDLGNSIAAVDDGFDEDLLSRWGDFVKDTEFTSDSQRPSNSAVEVECIPDTSSVEVTLDESFLSENSSCESTSVDGQAFDEACRRIDAGNRIAPINDCLDEDLISRWGDFVKDTEFTSDSQRPSNSAAEVESTHRFKCIPNSSPVEGGSSFVVMYEDGSIFEQPKYSVKFHDEDESGTTNGIPNKNNHTVLEGDKIPATAVNETRHIVGHILLKDTSKLLGTFSFVYKVNETLEKYNELLLEAEKSRPKRKRPFVRQGDEGKPDATDGMSCSSTSGHDRSTNQ